MTPSPRNQFTSPSAAAGLLGCRLNCGAATGSRVCVCACVILISLDSSSPHTHTHSHMTTIYNIVSTRSPLASLTFCSPTAGAQKCVGVCDCEHRGHPFTLDVAAAPPTSTQTHIFARSLALPSNRLPPLRSAHHTHRYCC